MTEQQLIQMGFKKKKLDDDYWYELSIKGHKFITNDTLRNKRKDKWFIGYQAKWDNGGFWFNEKLTEESVFKVIFHLLTGKEFKLDMKMKDNKHIKSFNEHQENLNISGVISSKILCRTCATYSGCKLDKKGTATKCRNFWEHHPTSDFIK